MSTTLTKTNQIETKDKNKIGQQGHHNNGLRQQSRPTFQPRFDIWEGEEELILYGDLPGVSSEDLNVRFESRQLTIHGKVSRCHGEQGCLYSEYGVGDFERTFTIGEAIDSEAISAELQNGVLTLHLPKSEKSRPRRIQVKPTAT